MWLLSERAVRVLMKRSGWKARAQEFAGGGARPYELYAQFGLALGRMAVEKDAEINRLTCGVFLCRKRSFITRHEPAAHPVLLALQNLVLDETKLGWQAAAAIPINTSRTRASAIRSGARRTTRCGWRTAPCRGAGVWNANTR